MTLLNQINDCNHVLVSIYSDGRIDGQTDGHNGDVECLS